MYNGRGVMTEGDAAERGWETADHRGQPKSLPMSSGDVKDMGDNGGYSPSATASSCEKGGKDPGRV